MGYRTTRRQMKRQNPKDRPLSQWADGWLVMEVASLLDTPGYILMADSEREREGYPASRDQRADFIASRREADALLAAGERR